MTKPAAVVETFPFVGPDSLQRAAVVCHRNADADAYLSAFAVSTLIRRIAPGCQVEIVTPQGMTALTKKLAAIFPHSVIEESQDDFDLYVAVDVGDTELLKGWEDKMSKSEGVKVLIDHHPIRSAQLYDRMIVDEGATSACEVVYGIFQGLGEKPDRVTAQALLEGVLFDSQHLTIATANTLRVALSLVDAGADVELARSTLRSEPEPGEVIAKLKGAQRLKIFRLGPWVAATSEIGSFQAQVARALIYLGADVSAVGGTTEDETRVSMRCSQKFHNATGVHLGKGIAVAAEATLGGHGGGHATAASLTSTKSADESLSFVLGMLAALLGVEVLPVK